MQAWMRDDPKHYPTHGPRAGESPDARPSADDLRYGADHPGADSLLPLLARLCGRPVALVTRPNRRYAPSTPTITVYQPSDHRPHREEVQAPGLVAERPPEGNTGEPHAHDPNEILIMARRGGRYIALRRLFDAPPTRSDGPPPWFAPDDDFDPFLIPHHRARQPEEDQNMTPEEYQDRQ